MPSLSLGAARMRQRVAAALLSARASIGRARWNRKAGTPDCSAAS